MKIKGDLDLSGSSIESLGNLEEIIRALKLSKCENLKTLGKLTKVLFFINASYCISLVSLGELREVSSLNLSGCINLKSLGKLQIAKEVILKNTGVTKEYIEKEKPQLLEICKWDFGIKYGLKVI